MLELASTDMLSRLRLVIDCTISRSLFMGQAPWSSGRRQNLGGLIDIADAVAVVAVVGGDVEQCERVSVLGDAVE